MRTTRQRANRAGDGQSQHPQAVIAGYEAFEPSEARRIAERLEIHYTPKHGSWLNMAEIEIGVLARQLSPWTGSDVEEDRTSDFQWYDPPRLRGPDWPLGEFIRPTN